MSAHSPCDDAPVSVRKKLDGFEHNQIEITV